jgi:hypothetical protein
MWRNHSIAYDPIAETTTNNFHMSQYGGNCCQKGFQYYNNWSGRLRRHRRIIRGHHFPLDAPWRLWCSKCCFNTNRHFRPATCRQTHASTEWFPESVGKGIKGSSGHREEFSTLDWHFEDVFFHWEEENFRHERKGKHCSFKIER